MDGQRRTLWSQVKQSSELASSNRPQRMRAVRAWNVRSAEVAGEESDRSEINIFRDVWSLNSLFFARVPYVHSFIESPVPVLKWNTLGSAEVCG